MPSIVAVSRHSPSPVDLAMCRMNSLVDLQRSSCPVVARTRASSPADVRRDASPAGLRRAEGRRPVGKQCFATIGQSLMRRPSGHAIPRPSSRASSDDELDEDAMWRRERASIKKGLSRVASSPRTRVTASDQTADVQEGKMNLPVLKAPRQLPPLKDAPARLIGMQSFPHLLPDHHWAEEAVNKRARDAHAQQAACWEDLISFLELHRLPGAYALAFSANGVENLTSFLSLDDAALSSLFEKCSIDAVDEILILAAVRKARLPD